MDTPDNTVIKPVIIKLKVDPSATVIRAEPSQFVFCCTVSPVFVIIPAVFVNISEACGQRTPRAGFLNHDFAICQTPSVFP